MPRKSKSRLKRLRELRAAGVLSAAEFRRLTKKRKVTRKQRTAALRNLRRACKSIDGSKKTRRGDKLSRQVASLQSEINATLRRERLKEKLKKLKDERRALRSALRSKSSNSGFLLGSAQY